jgi:hypothetical protein
MADGGFLQGLSEGIFERMGQLRSEQQAKDDQKKQDTIRLLSGLADKVEPESLPMLMSHIWDVAGIKQSSSGKGLRGFLDAFSGMPNRSVEDQLGSKFRELTKGMVGPQQARDTRLRSNISQKGIPGLVNAAPNSAYGQQASQDLQDMKGKMVFRDPYQQELDKIEARYGSALENQRVRQQNDHDAAMQRLITGYDLKNQQDQNRYTQKINFATNALARTYMTHPDVIKFPPELRVAAARQMAMDTLAKEEDLKVQNLSKNLEVKDAVIQEKRNNLTGKGSPSVQISRERLAHTKQMDRNKMQDELSKAQADYDAFTPQLSDLEKSLDNEAKRYGTTRQKLLEGESILSGAGPIATKINDYKKLQKAHKEAEATLNTKKKQLEDYDKTSGGKTAKPPAKPSLLTPTPRESGMPGNWVKVSKAQIEARGKKTGDDYDTGGKKYTIGELKGEWYILKPRQ